MSFISEYIQKKISTESSKKNLSFLDDLEELEKTIYIGKYRLCIRKKTFWKDKMRKQGKC